MTSRARVPMLRTGIGSGRVTNVELFFDLVYVFAVTQLSHLLVERPTADGAVQAAVLLALVWQAWVYTTWSVDYLDPDRPLPRAMLLLVMVGSLVLAAGLPEAFENRGLLVAVTYSAIQVGRTVLTLIGVRGSEIEPTFRRILVWSVVSSVAVLVGAFQTDHVREVLWAGSVAIDLVGAVTGFRVPGLGRSWAAEWRINGGHFAERCQAFVLIALGESIVVIGGLLRIEDPTWANVLGFAVGFAGAVGLWWIYFDRTAGESAHVLESSAEPGKLARSAFHYVHPIVIAGIIVSAAADEEVLAHPMEAATPDVTWLLLGGSALFLGGHALFTLVVWRTVSWTRVAGVVVLGLLALLAPHVSRLPLGICTLAVIVVVAIGDRLLLPPMIDDRQLADDGDPA